MATIINIMLCKSNSHLALAVTVKLQSFRLIGDDIWCE